MTSFFGPVTGRSHTGDRTNRREPTDAHLFGRG